jgi:hypothetical protein
MNTYRILVHDAHGGAPTVLTAELASDARALEFAHERLAAHPEVAAIEVWIGAARLRRFDRESCEAA